MNAEPFFLLRTGSLAYLDTFAGLAPCKITAVDDRQRITVQLTATRGAYKRGEIIANQRPGFNVVPRTAVYTRNGTLRIAGLPVHALPDGSEVAR